MNAWLIFFFIPSYIGAVSIGSIRNVTFTVTNSSVSNTMNGTKQACLCAMQSSSNISALNYFSNDTCQLFSNASIMNVYYSWTPNVNALFYFLFFPIRATTIANHLSTISSTVSSQYQMTTAETSTANMQTNPTPTNTLVHNTTAATVLPSTVAGTGSAGSSMNKLSTPNDVFVTSNGTLYVADCDNSRVQIFGPGNTAAISSQLGMGKPITVCVDNASNYYVTELVSTSNRISKWPSNRTVLLLFNAYGIARDSNGNLYLSTLDNTIVFWNASFNLTTIIIPASKGLSGPRHIFLDEPNQALYIADSLKNRIVKFLIGIGNFTVVAGGNGQGTAVNQLNYPAGVCVSKRDGTVYVADANNNRVQKWAPNSSVGSTILGYANGTAASGTYGLNGPYAVALDATETFLYVADSNNNRIQRLPLS